MERRIGIVGTGSFGTTMAVVLATNLKVRNEQDPIFMYVRRKELLDQLTKSRIHPEYEALKDVPIPRNIQFTESLEEALGSATHCVFGTPSKYARSTLDEMAKFVKPGCRVVSLVKGFHLDEGAGTFVRMSTLISKCLGIADTNVCSLGGPNIYAEIASSYSANTPVHRVCNAVISSVAEVTAREFQELYFTKDTVRTYYSHDIVSSEICGALKNVIALMAGIGDGYYDGQGMGFNFKASLITRASFEISYFARAFGGSPDSAYGLAGLGDLIATCMRGRNYAAGVKLSSLLTVEEVKAQMHPNEIEGLQTLDVVNRFLTRLRHDNPQVALDLPIIESIYNIVYGGKDVHKAINDVINRPMKKELRTDPYIVAA